MTAACPFCGSEDVEQVAAWGGQIITSQAHCRACGTYFEVVRDSFAGPAGSDGSMREPVWTTSSEDDR